MKKLCAFSLLCFVAWGVAAQTTAKLRNPKAPTAQANQLGTCVPAGHADAQRLAQTWGATLATEGMHSPNARAARAQWKLAAQCYRQAAKLEPTNSQAINGWGMALGLEARALATTNLPAARAMFRQAGDKFALALQLNWQNSIAAYHWGIALGDEAMAITAAVPGDLTADLPGAGVLWDLARQKYALAQELDHNNAQIADNWGGTYAVQAQALASSDLPAARALWQQAYDRFTLATHIDPAHLDAAHNLAGAMLAERAALLKSPSPQSPLSPQAVAEAADLLQRAKKVLLADADNPNAKAAYNLACMYALEGHTAQAMQYLLRSAAAGKLPHKSHIAQDSDLDSLRNTPAFAAWLAQLQ
jgi:hypothetical protein